MFSKIRQWLGKKIIGNPYKGRPQSVITKEMQEKALEQRRQAYKIRRLEKQAEMQKRFEILESAISAEKSGGFEQVLMEKVLPIFIDKLKKQNVPKDDFNNEKVKEIVLSDEQIKKMLEENPNLREEGKIASEKQIHEFMVQNIPNISSESIKRVIVEVKK